MDNIEFAKKNTEAILEKLVYVRIHKNDFRAYKTLTNSLNESIRPILHLPYNNYTDEIKKFSKIIIDRVNKEMVELQAQIASSIVNNDYKAHHEWLLSYGRLTSFIHYLTPFTKDKESIDKYCSSCQKNLPIESFYYADKETYYKGRYSKCKKCCNNQVKTIDDIKEMLKEMNKPFIKEVYEQSLNERERTDKNIVGLYMKNMTLSQYRNLKWSDSRF